MLKKSILLILFYSFSFFSSQTPKSIDDKINQAYNLSITNKRSEALKLLLEANASAKKIGYKNGIKKSYNSLIAAYTYKGDFKKVIDIADETEKILEYPNDIEKLIFLYQYRGTAYKNTGFLDQGLREMNKAIYYAKKLPNNDSRHSQLSFTYQILAELSEDMKHNDSMLYYLHKSNSEAELISNHSPDKYYKNDYIIFNNMNIANFYRIEGKSQKLDSAEKYINKVLSKKDTKTYFSNQLEISSTLAEFYLQKKEYKKTMFYANEMLQLEKKSSRPEIRRDAYSILQETYGKMKDNDMQLKYLKLYTKLNDSINSLIKSEFQNSAKHITNSNKKEYNDKIDNFSMYALVGICSIIVCFVIIWRFHLRNTKRKYEHIIKRLSENEDDDVISNDNIDNELVNEARKNNSVQITDSTVQSILSILDQFEKNNEFTEKDVSFVYLAKLTNTNTKYLNEVLKNQKGKTFSKYINGLRVNYIMKILYHEPKYREYKISYLAEICGFSSREVFSTVFKKETGITTTYYINQLREEENKEHANSL